MNGSAGGPQCSILWGCIAPRISAVLYPYAIGMQHEESRQKHPSLHVQYSHNPDVHGHILTRSVLCFYMCFCCVEEITKSRVFREIMSDRPDLIQSELSGMAFDSLQVVFRSTDVEIMFTQEPPAPTLNADCYIFIDPAAGGPQSDYAVLSFQRVKGLITVSFIKLNINLSLYPQTRLHPGIDC